MTIPIADVGYAVLGTLCLIGFIIAILSKMNLMSFGKTTASVCDDCSIKIAAGAREAQRDLLLRMARIEDDHTSIWAKLDKISDDVSYVRGWLERNGNPK